MKHFTSLCLTALLMLAGGSVPASAAWDSSGTIYYLRTNDGLDDNITVDGTVKFISQSSASVPTYRDGGVNFVPANEGEVIKISVDYIDLTGGNYLCLYDHRIEKISSGTSSSGNQSSYLPDGWLYKLTAGDEGLEYTSTADDGSMAFALHTGSAVGQKGFTITVSSVSLKDMEYVSATAFEPETTPRRGQNDALLMGVRVTTDGGSNPLSLNNLSVDCSALAGYADKLSNVRLYRSATVADENLLATAATAGATLTARDIVLKSGKNDFYIVADIAADAYGPIALPTVTAITVDGSARTPDQTSVSGAEIANEIWMPAGNAVYTISDDAMFYDDGGPEGNIAMRFIGTVTFVPSTPGNAIKVDVSRLDIFNTSSTGMNDVFTFYNGREADDENLVATLLKDTRVVKSTAADGSLTVRLVSTTGVPKSGWEAVVSEFVPTNMTLTGISAKATDDVSTIIAGQQDIELFSVDITTDNNVDPLSLTGMSLTTADPAALTAIKIWGYDNTAVTPVRRLLATITPAAAMNVTLDAVLAEGVNRFDITADAAGHLASGAHLAVNLTSVTVGGTTGNVDAAADREVLNVWKSAEGTNTVNLNGAWGYTHTPAGEYSENYAPGNTDQTVTFVPVTAGTVASIDFETFDVYYASSSYGAKAVFEVYSGSDCNSDRLLWKLDSNAKSKTGPGRTLRSAAANGALTVKFNPNTTSSYYTGKGWKASVTEFLNHDMTITGATATLPTEREMAIGATDEPMLDIVLSTEGTLTLKTIDEFTFSVAGHEAVKAIKVYTSVNADGSDAALFGRTDDVKAMTTVAGSARLTEGANYFFVYVDIADDATPDTNVGVGLTSVKDSRGNTDACADCIPEVLRPVKDMLITEEGEHTVVLKGGKMWYDDGGADGNITANLTATYTFVPDREGYAVTLNASEFKMGNGRVYVYNGRTADENNRLGTITGYSGTTGPANLRSKADDGSITVTVKAPTYAMAGFAMAVGMQQKVDYYLAATESGAASAATRYTRGSQNVPLVRVKADIEGDLNGSEISGLTFSLAGTDNLADITSLSLYYGGTSAVFSPTGAELLATATPDGESVTFDAAVSTGDCGSYYLYLVADFSAEATPDNKVAAALTGIKFNGEAVELAEQPVSTVILMSGLKGAYTIGKSAEADFATFSEAVDAFEFGIEGPVTFEIEDGTYAENLKLVNIGGTSEQNTIIIRSKSRDRDAVTITGNYTNADKAGIIQISGTPYVTVSDLTVNAGSQSFENAVYVADASHHTTLTRLNVSAEKVTASSGINLIRTYTTTAAEGEGRNNDFFTLTSSALTGGRIGMYLASNGIVARVQDRGYVVTGNTITDCGNKSVYCTDLADMTFANNIITAPAPAKGTYVADIYRIKGGNISGNRAVIGSEGSSTDFYAFYFRQGCTGTAESPIRFYNNEIVLVNAPNVYTRALHVTNDCGNIDVAYNTLRASGTAAYLFSTSGKAGEGVMTVRGNIFHNDCSAEASYPLYFWNSDDIARYTFDNNAFYSSNGSVCKNDSEILDFDGFATLSGKETNLSEQAIFVSATDSHLLEPGNLQCGTPVDYITVDRTGIHRDATAPTLGAYEYVTVSTEPPVIAEGYPTVGAITVNSASVRTQWDMSGKLYAIAVEWSDEAMLPEVDDVLAATPVEIIADTEYSWNFTDLADQTDYRAFLVAESVIGVRSAMVATDVFTTLRFIPALEVGFADETVTVDYGESVQLEAFVEGGDEPYTYVWTAQDGSEAGNTAALDITPDVPGIYTVAVTSADGQTVSADIAVEVEGAPSAVATFEDNALEAGTSVMPDGDGWFYSGTYAFNYGAWPAYNYWFGFTLSSETENTYASLDDQWRSAPGGAYSGDNFVVGFPEGLKIEVTNNAEGEVIPGFYVTNSAYAYTSMTRGDGFNQPFSEGDWFKLSARIWDADGNQSDHELLYLADYRDPAEAEHYVVDCWEYVDLSQFGPVTALTFVFSGSDMSEWGLNTPTYLCIDNFGAKPDAEEFDLTLSAGAVYDTESYFDIADNGARAEYSLTQLSGAEKVHFELTGSTITFEPVDDCEIEQGYTASVMVAMRQKGHTQRVILNFTADGSLGIGDITVDDADGVWYDTRGIRVDIRNAAPGVYLRRDGDKVTKKVIK